MANQSQSPYICHEFVCTNDRHGERKSCSDGNSQMTRAHLKQGINSRGWKGLVRISQCGCMGLCQDGPNVMIYPQRIWYSGVSHRSIARSILYPVVPVD